MCNHEELCEMIIEVKEELHNHIEKEDQDRAEVMALMRDNSKSISELSKEVASLKDEVKDLLEIYRDFIGLIRIGAKFGRFLKWVVGLGAIVVLFDWIANHLK